MFYIQRFCKCVCCPSFYQRQESERPLTCQVPRQFFDLFFEALKRPGSHLMPGLLKPSPGESVRVDLTRLMTDCALIFHWLLVQRSPSSVLFCPSRKSVPPYFQVRRPRNPFQSIQHALYRQRRFSCWINCTKLSTKKMTSLSCFELWVLKNANM